MKYYTDGSSTIGVKSAYAVTDDKGKVIDFKESYASQNIREFTNNEEEYRGVIAALTLCAEGDQVCTDSQLVVNQVSGRFKVKKAHLQAYCDRARELIKEKKAELVWIGRDLNMAGKIFEK